MNFDPTLLETYRTLLQTTDLQKAYQEFIRLFRFLRNELERQMPDFRFQSSITENAMDYAYFSLTNPALKEKCLKLTTGTSNWRCGSPEPTGLLSADGLSNGEPVLRLWNLLRNPIAPTLWCACQWKQIYPMGRKRLLRSKRRQSNCCKSSYKERTRDGGVASVPC